MMIMHEFFWGDSFPSFFYVYKCDFVLKIYSKKWKNLDSKMMEVYTVFQGYLKSVCVYEQHYKVIRKNFSDVHMQKGEEKWKI